jgi:hypothetical protein
MAQNKNKKLGWGICGGKKTRVGQVGYIYIYAASKDDQIKGGMVGTCSKRFDD